MIAKRQSSKGVPRVSGGCESSGQVLNPVCHYMSFGVSEEMQFVSIEDAENTVQCDFVTGYI